MQSCIILPLANPFTSMYAIIAWKALGRYCTNNNGLILLIGVLSCYIINEGLYHTVFAGIRYLGVYI